jgi:hypothetical protein
MPGNPEECRAYAEMCLLLARNAPDEIWREHFCELALNWEWLAADIESASGFIQTMAAVHFRPRKAA